MERCRLKVEDATLSINVPLVSMIAFTGPKVNRSIKYNFKDDKKKLRCLQYYLRLVKLALSKTLFFQTSKLNFTFTSNTKH